MGTAMQKIVSLILISFVVNCANRYQENELASLLLINSGQNEISPSILVLGGSLTEYSRGFGLEQLLSGRYDVH